uniref:Uncharacterized protein n=1 Tax=Polytomella parva TaxID=51329 RepID=A0A7S0UZT2_9CHLO|mmetsp:Transcript_19884/g.35813  ORF Transcript_19884/g.35813 Transcript_19884/m.35813 type:complete len:309 (+) Transcript_19884:61-987(+)|eukprot:CAMPEP_0175056436 /NCGR_PEP_ID=MMETSP0052_2-20121109/10667_1 /TAXON_ID=51329 ORGANISM="Polytomella parva, Strain SAG 63-3" /NCGR_SAMPLE_ID=MMETSP0052_2 /ASSEMBLY_ACC=CAM_ASM_000194 /LENGTH=308 /DNA_ID=CAMNT_0016321457 /DNA_START=12 /DNA_END=938 /DNA_ORIENTATION=+
MALSACLGRLTQSGSVSLCVRSLRAIGQYDKIVGFENNLENIQTTVSQQRCYHVIKKTFKPSVPYSQICGRPAPESLPYFQVLKNADKPDTFPKYCVRIPSGVQLKVNEPERVIELEGKAGSLTFDMKRIDPEGLVGFLAEKAENSEFCSSLTLTSPIQEKLTKYIEDLQKAIRGVSQGYIVGLTVKGVGYRMEPVDEIPVKYQSWHKSVYYDRSKIEKPPAAYPYKKPSNAVLLKVGFSDPAVFMLPPTIKAFFLKPTMVYLYGLNIDELRKTAMEIRALRKPNVFTGNGIALMDETVRIKARANKK